MIFIHARSLTARDMASLGNNVAPAVQRERRRPPADLPIVAPAQLDGCARHYRPTIVLFNTPGTSPAA
jgi:hypothetical protein